MYLTSFDINMARRRAQVLVGSPRMMHGAVQACFPPGALADGRALWRIDRWANRTVLYIVSPAVPDVTHLTEQAGWPALPSTGRTVDYTSFLADIRAGNTYQFRLEANPTHAAPQDGGKRGKRFGHVTATQQWEWLHRRAPHLGVDLGTEDEPRGYVVSRDIKTFRRDNHDVTLSTAVYEGHLVVQDADLLRAALVGGVGRAKAYGCGLMTLSTVGKIEA